MGLEDEVPVNVVPLGARFVIGPFDMELITVTHSTLEPNAVAIRTRLGTILHTGDFKIDPAPMIGECVDDAALRRVGDEGVLAMVCDSTNVFQSGESGSGGALRESLDAIFADCPGRIVVTTFASNVTRIETIVKLGQRHGRQVALAGRSLWRIVEAAREAGYLKDLPPLLSEDEVGYLPRDKILVLATGSQGESRAAMAKIASDAHPRISLEAGDTVVFSSKVIPGNEKAIFRLYDRLMGRGIRVITEADHFVHVSGHPSRDELARFYRWVRPRVAVPVHGERRHLAEHVALATSLQVPEAVQIENGDVLRLAPGPAAVVDRVANGRLGLDGSAIIPLDSEVLRQRRRLMRGGAVFVVLVIDEAGELLAPPRWRAEGVFTDGAIPVASLCAEIHAALGRLSRTQRRDDEAVTEAARISVRRAFRRAYDTRPTVAVEVVRL